MKVEMIPNRYPANMGRELEQSLNWADEADIASAYVSTASLGRLESALERAQIEKRPLKVRLLFGLYQRFTPPEALAKMLRLQKTYPSKFIVRIARNNRFHWKLYRFRRDALSRLYIGSANLTEDGLDASGDLSVKITAATSEPIAKSLMTEFDALWHKDAFLLDRVVLKKYRSVKRPPRFVTLPDKDDPISTLLKSAQRPPPPPSAKSKPRLVFVDWDISDETDKIIRSEKGWQIKGWDYLCYRHRDLYDHARNAGVILLVDRLKAKRYCLQFRRIEDAVEIETRDGKYFIAHSAVPHGWNSNYDTIKRELAKIGLTLKKIKSNRYLNEKETETLCRLLHVKRDKLDTKRR